jgi:hypothetical protein
MSPVRAYDFRPIGVDSAYAAFPSVCRFSSGQLRLVWRQGADHVDARDGEIHTATSVDDGMTWSPASVALKDTADLRDPCISSAGGTTWLTYFKGTSTLPAAGCFLRVSTDDGVTWSDETRIDNQPYAAMSAPVVQLGSALLAAYYGRDAGDTRDSCWLAASTDGGTTWSRRRVADGPADRRDYQEPWLVARGAEVWMFLRYGHYSAIGASVSTDGGATWSKPRRLFANTTARPAAILLSTGGMAVVARRVSDGQPVIRTNERRPRVVMPQPRSGPIGMLYAHPLEIPGGVICAVGIESSATAARIHVGRLGLHPLPHRG